MNAESLLKSGDIIACKKQLFIEIKQDPSNIKLRIFLFQLCCITREWQRAQTQLDVLREMSDASLAMVNTYQQLIDCEKIRESVLKGQREPSCFGEPSNWLAYYVKAYQHYVENNLEHAMHLIEQGADLAPAISGTINDDDNFQWLSDGDIRFGPAFEVILNGGYYWLPIEYIAEINFEPVEDLRDLVWRPANITLKNKGQLIIFVPVRYPDFTNITDELLLAKTCQWQEPIDNFYIGQGQRILMTDENEYPLLSINSLKFDHS